MKSDTEKRLEQYGVWVKVKPREVGKPKAQETSFELSDLEIPESIPMTEPAIEQPESGASDLPPLDAEFDQEPSAPSGQSVRPLTPEEERLIGAYTPEESDTSLTQEEEKLLDDLESELAAPVETPDATELDLAVESPPILEESAQGLEVPEIALGQESGEELPELELEEESTEPTEGGAGFPEEESETAVDVPLSDEIPQDEHFDDLKALEDELSAVKAGASAVSQTGASAEVLARIEEELKSIKTDLTDLRRTMTELRQAPPQKEEPTAAGEENKGFFEEDEDETIALTGDELDNILNTAEVTEGTAEPEAMLPNEPDTLLEKPDILEYAGENPKESAETPEAATDVGKEPTAAPVGAESSPEVPLDELVSSPIEELTLEDETPVEGLASESVDELTLEDETPVEDLASESVEELSLEEEAPVEDLASESVEELTFEEETPVEDLALEEEAFDEAVPMEEMETPLIETEKAAETTPGEIGANLLDIDLSIEDLKMEEPSADATPDLELSLEESASETEKPAGKSAVPPSEDLVLEEPLLEIEDFEEVEETPGTTPASDTGIGDNELELEIENTDNAEPDGAETADDIETVPMETLPGEANLEPKEITIDDDILQKEIREIDADTQLEGLETEAEIPKEEPQKTEELPDAVMELEPAQPVESTEAESPSDRASIPDDLKDEVRSVLKYLDQLLEALPEDKIKEFADSEYFTMYKKLFEELGLGG